MSRARKVLISCVALLCVLAAAAFFYLFDYSRPAEHALACLEGDCGRAATAIDGGYAFVPSGEEDAKAGVVLYPGGKVACQAYAPLACQLAERGITCVVVEMPANIAFLGIGAADDVMPLFPGVERWYVAGHSLGGVAAASYAADHADVLEGVVLLASYSTEDLGESGLGVLSVRGSLDGVLDADAYRESLPNIESDRLVELVIEGANHSQFGCYGLQEGDNPAAITEEEQLGQTADAIAALALG